MNIIFIENLKLQRLLNVLEFSQKKKIVLDFNVHPKLVGRDLVAIFADIGGN